MFHRKRLKLTGRVYSAGKPREMFLKNLITGSIFILIAFAFINANTAHGELTVSVGKKAANVAFSRMDEDSLLVSVTDQNGKALLGLEKNDFLISRNGKKAKILSVEPFLKKVEIGLNIVMVVDNSFSMKERRAISPLLKALNRFLGRIRLIDRVHLIVFDDENTVSLDGYNLHVDIQSSNDPEILDAFLEGRFSKDITSGTYLYDAIYAGLDLIEKMPVLGNRFMVVFSDGEEINSSVPEKELTAAAEKFDFRAYAIDYMPKQTRDPFLLGFSQDHNGQLWKAQSADELLPIFEELSTTMFQQYVVTYRFAAPPEGMVSIEPTTEIRIEEVTTIDSSPLLNYVFFENGSSRIPKRYITFTRQEQADNFEVRDLKGTMEKYRHLMNIFGKRMRENPDAKITLVGCNSGFGKEKNNIELSRSRADSVAHYLQYIWRIDPSRIATKARNLPEIPSTSRVPEGRSENQRVEIHSDHPAVLDTVKSTYLEKMSSTETIRLVPRIRSEAGIEQWSIHLFGDDDIPFKKIFGKEEPEDAYVIRLKPGDLDKLAGFERLTVGFRVESKEGEVYEDLSASSISVRYIKREKIDAEKIGQKIYEKFALILFDFDRAVIDGRNMEILNEIQNRIRILPNPQVNIVGHTDVIGTEKYNKKLSTSRAENAHKDIVSALDEVSAVSYSGIGESAPLYDNGSPEGRMLNRTVIIHLIYEKQ